MVLFLCYVFLIILHDMLTKEEVNVMGLCNLFRTLRHRDIEDFLLLRKNHGNEEDRARDLFYALWIPDLFMKRVKENGKWTLFCPDENQVLQKFMEKNLKDYMKNMKVKETELLLRRVNYGIKF